MSKHNARGGWFADPGAGAGPLAIIPPDNEPDVHAEGAHRPWVARNGMPEPGGYIHRRGEAERDAEIAELVAEAKQRAQAKNSDGEDAA